jgi:lipid-binding SYLF domain-containing protein
MKNKGLALCLGAGLLAAAPALRAQDKEQRENNDRLAASVAVFHEIMATPDRGIPHDLFDRAQCVVIVPGVKKGAFIVGAEYGKGYFTCRRHSGHGWTAPGAVIVEGGSFGFQIGGEETDVVMLVMNDEGERRLLSSQFKLGGDASVAAGPVGRNASADTDLYMGAEILSWSRSRGVFAGVSLAGATVRQDLKENNALYGRMITNKEVIEGQSSVPAQAEPLVQTLTRYSPRKNEVREHTASAN